MTRETILIKCRNWFRTNGKMDFELNPNMPKIEQGKQITYNCKEIDNLFAELLQEYADLQKPEWIPIIDGDLSWLPDTRVIITVKNAHGELYVNEASGQWIKQITKNRVIAWMPYTEPTPYQP